MYLYDYVYSITFILLYLNRINSSNNVDLQIVSNVDPLTINSVGLQFSVTVNNTSNNCYDLELVPDQCCLDGQKQDCDVLEIVGHCFVVIPEGTTKTMKLIAPLLNPFDRKGFCTVYLDSKPTNGQRNMMRGTHRIIFDTTIKEDNASQVAHNLKAVHCTNIDEDPLNDCKPVDCETYYNGKRSYFNEKLKRCVGIPICVPDDNNSDIIYNPVSNSCYKDNYLIKDDIEFIKNLAKKTDRKPKDVVIIKNLHNNEKLEDLPKKIPEEKFTSKVFNDEGNFCCRFQIFLKENKCTLIVLGTIILIQCCLISSMIYYLCNNCNCREKKVVRKYFNYRQDASVTTPLIGTSNIDTETTEYQCLSELSNNIDKKIKCYKSCQKLIKNNAKISMSDDILSKCLNRRDWHRKSNKTDSVIPDIHISRIEENVTPQIKEMNEDISSTGSKEENKSKETKVNFETENVEINEKSKEIKGEKSERKRSKIIRNLVTKIEKKCSNEKKGEKKEDKEGIGERMDDLANTSSEKEIKCHSYNYVEGGSNLTGYKLSNPGKNFDCYKAEQKKETISLSSEKGAQAYFSNDSIDDFLSERGMIFLADENTSKYSCFSESNSSSEVSSKTSKKNVVKNVLSLFHKKSKHGPSSDPGVKINDSVDVELIHMSHASIYSSTNNGSGYFSAFKKPKDSRTPR